MKSIIFATKGGYILTVDKSKGLKHYGTPRHSGRYPWGSGKNPQRSRNWLSNVRDMKKNHGMSEKEIAKAYGISIQELRNRIQIETNAEKQARIAQYEKLRAKGMSRNAAAKRLGVPEGTVRGWENQKMAGRTKIIDNVSSSLKDRVDEMGYVDIGKGAETQLDISPSRMKAVTQKLKDEGYVIQTIYVGDRKRNPTKVTVLAKPGTTIKDVYDNQHNIASIGDIASTDGGRTIFGMKRPVSIDSSRVYVRTKEEGGAKKDGTIELRPGVEDISLGGATYAQVRIGVDDKKYMKGMAFYGDEKDFPPGVDIIYNSNKSKDKPEKWFKPMKTVSEDSDEIDWDNPFGALLKSDGRGQREYTDPKTGEKKQSVVNIIREEGDWETWSKTLSSQFLSKQEPELVKDQLKLTTLKYKDRFDELKRISNPVIKRKELEDFSEECETAAEKLKAVRMPGQATKVLLPVPSLKDNECYAPHLPDGTKVVLIRHPHAGRFEIPELTVNNRNREAKRMMGNNPKDAIGIGTKAAEQLSGADFDGDTAIVIPNNQGRIKTEKAVKDLIEFDNKEQYAAYDGMPKVSAKNGFIEQKEMGKISNLITDMTEQGASIEEVIRADKHSMVIIDAEKHNLDWRRSYDENNIAELQKRYQKAGGGASTVVSKSKGEAHIDEIKRWKFQNNTVDPVTGEKIYEYTGRIIEGYTDKNGKYHPPKKAYTTTSKMRATNDARTLLTDRSNDIDMMYANFANDLKDIARQTRLEALKVTPYKVDKQAAKIYKDEVESLNRKLAISMSNRPKERQAKIYADYIFKLKKQDNPHADDDEQSKWRRQALDEGRRRFGVNGKESRVHFSKKEVEAINAYAITSSKLRELISASDPDNYNAMFFPKTEGKLRTPTKNRIKALARRDYSYAEIAEACGVSVSTVENVMSA